MTFYNRDLKPLSSALRKNMTDAEWRLWSVLRNKQLKGCSFHRQKIICNYIVDFYCPQYRVVIEVDGGQHYSQPNLDEDKKRDDYLEGHGFKVLRFTNLDILQNIDGVAERILENLEIPLSPPYK
jgi:very-short-patch-repair endonuclease